MRWPIQNGFFFSLLLLLVSISGLTQEPIVGPEAKADPVAKYNPTGYVNDFAGILDVHSQKRLDAISKNLDKKTQTQMVFVTINSLEGVPVKDFATQLANQWGVGHKETNRGLLVLWR